MTEADYGLVARLDLAEVSGVFAAWRAYQSNRQGMTPKRYDLSPADFDEDGVPVDTPSYNQYGDYILKRPDAEDDTPVYGLAVRYEKAAYPYEQYFARYNAVIERFTERGVTWLVTWSPRNSQALSEASTPEARAEMEDWFRACIHAPIISSL